MHRITLTRVKIEDNYTVRCDFEVSKPLRRFFAQEYFFATFNTEIHTVPASILTIPFLANIAPIVWSTDSILTVPVIDKDFLESLSHIKNSLQRMYPNMHFNGSITGERVESHDNEVTSSSAILFSGGVDSLTSFIQNKSHSPYLVTVWGADVSLGQKGTWNLVKSNVENFARIYNLKNLFITSNLRAFISAHALKAEFKKSIVDWWGSVQHGLGLLGLCAPLSYSLGIGAIFLPSSHTEDFDHPWGSHPSIDNLVRWTNTRVIHHGYEYSRQQKLNIIADYIKSEEPNLHIRVCYFSTDGKNCCKCEKCSRTITGLLLEGINPNQHGFSCDKKTFTHIQKQFTQGAWNISESDVFMWQDIQRKISLRTAATATYQNYFDWLARQNFEVLLKRAEQNRLRKVKAFAARKALATRKALAARLPVPAYNFLKQMKAVFR
jgi:hypothetical protein